jgi:RNA polymerase sigma factor (sigma-70 family)
VTTTSAPHESPDPHGRPLDRGVDGAAAARSAELFAQYGRTVSGLCKALLRDRAEAEDAAQQTFLSAHRALLNGVEPREPAAWLATIARNECWARTKTRMREPLPTDSVEGVSSDDPVHAAIRRADLAALWSAIGGLPKQQREALLLREFGGLSYDELAAALAVSGPAVESLLFRARTRLRRQLRTAYASLSGASWLESLARLFAGGGAPVAAKVAALGVGAVAVTGGAVVTPRVLAHRTERPAPVHTVERALPETPVVAPVAASVARPAPVSVAAPERREGRHRGSRPGPADVATRTEPPEERHETETHESGEHVSGGSAEPGRSGPGGGEDGSGGGGGESSGRGSGGSGVDGGSDGGSGGSGGGDGGGSGGSSGTDDGGRSGHGGGDETIPTVPAPTVTQPGVTVPTDPSQDD